MPCAASGDDGIAWQATHQFCSLVPQRTAFHSRVSRNVLASEERHRARDENVPRRPFNAFAPRLVRRSTTPRASEPQTVATTSFRGKPSRFRGEQRSGRNRFAIDKQTKRSRCASAFLRRAKPMKKLTSCRNCFLGLLHFVIVEKSVTVEIT